MYIHIYIYTDVYTHVSIHMAKDIKCILRTMCCMMHNTYWILTAYYITQYKV